PRRPPRPRPGRAAAGHARSQRGPAGDRARTRSACGGQSLMSDQSKAGRSEDPTNRSNLHERLRDRIGQDIVAGRLAPGTTIKAQELRTRYDVSLSRVREVVRVNEPLGVLRPIRRVALVVARMDAWSLLN